LEVTTTGTKLSLIYGERDLLVAEALREGVWSKLDAATLSGLIAALVYEARRDDEHTQPRFPRGDFQDAFERTVSLWSALEKSSKRHKLRATDPIDAGVSYAIHRWVSGSNLDNVLYEADLLVGDFIRLSKQIIDLLEQVSRAAEEPLKSTANLAIEKMKRGIVAYSYYV
jgi:ATP-dependent RNA helicase HelY